MTRRRTTRSRGFATLTALTLLAFVAVLLTAMGTWIGLDARRSHEAAVEAQLRQLLLAGAAIAIASDGHAANDVALPPALAADGARLIVRAANTSESARRVTIEATIGDRQSRQVITLARRGDRWVMTDAALDPA